MNLVEKALQIALDAHRGQVDKAGMPYIMHPIAVAIQQKTTDAFAVALLHDVMEDSPYTAEDLKNEGIPQNIIEALLLLTHDKNEPYMEYIGRIKSNKLAKSVKLADLRHNSNLSRLQHVSEADKKRVEKYAVAIAILE